MEREKLKALLLQHLEEFAGGDGLPLKELHKVHAELKYGQFKALLQELRAENKVHCRGHGRGAMWFPGPEPGELAGKG